jgi:hypothetical protein
MSNRTHLISWVLALVPALGYGQALDPSTVTLDAAGAEKSIRATQEMAGNGHRPVP